MTDRESLVEAFWTWEQMVRSPDRSTRLDADNWIWALQFVLEAMEKADEAAVELLDELLHAEQAEPGTVGAGPLEDLLSRHGSEVADLVLPRARRDEAWRLALAACWLSSAEREAVPSLIPYLPRPLVR